MNSVLVHFPMQSHEGLRIWNGASGVVGPQDINQLVDEDEYQVPWVLDGCHPLCRVRGKLRGHYIQTWEMHKGEVGGDFCPVVYWDVIPETGLWRTRVRRIFT